MKKRIIGGWVLAMALTACGGTEDSSPIATTTDDGQSMVILEGPSVAEEPVASYEETDQSGVAKAAGCWVVLDYCRSPTTGGPTCHATNCTVAQAIEACKALIRKYC